MAVRIETQKIIFHSQRNAASFENLVDGHHTKRFMPGKKRCNHTIVFLIQQTARRVHQPASGFDESCRRGEDARLDIHEARNFQRPPFDVRIAALCAGAAARRIHQHPVHFAREPCGAVIVFMRDAGHTHIV